MTKRVIVGCVGNVLRGDDGFGPAVADRLSDLPDGAEVIAFGAPKVDDPRADSEMQPGWWSD